ncbi:uncharacterized protein SPAPADRAFT_59030 [Spathaspora passalidarum NRRL Y-27907]|uniref:CID domain-containing protein n=1 Tax=Spathaspora passalidarum (strain NRRL Y-27907 / 11-Y1) TaxID=619300 RepID=G3AI89_SPAPN|nr:uncharacterized protein SPAPADRAFT_59030 [Spathaspora passalidarum NRRL Y-27907]EGW33659.1 hypothetical protein SPAPADRAFT_59030 [Spathaspora passalidarum NRRL Y-27907]
MSFSSSSFCKKLDILQETQESIVSISQWVLFYQKHCKDSARTWADYTISKSHPSNKKLSLLYVCNDIVQQARRKRKQEFITEFAKVLPGVLQKIYPTVDSSIKAKIDRLISVWEQRQIFDSSDIARIKGSLTIQEQPTESKLTNSVQGDSIVPDLKHINDLYIHLNQLTDLSQANLTQFGIQSKTYLPHDPTLSENLPAPRQYISKLNMLEELSKVSINNITEIKNTKLKIKTHLDNLSRLLSEGIKTEDSKIGIINEKLTRLHTTRDELKSMLESGDGNQQPPQQLSEDEEESPTFEAIADDDDDDDDDLLPTYEDDDEKPEESNKRRYSQTPSGGSTPSSKRVAFSEDIEVKEYDRDDSNEADNNKPPESPEIAEMIHHHKDSLELKHEQETVKSSNGDSLSNEDVMSLLSKLA